MHFLDLINWLNMKNSVVRKEGNILRAVIFYAITSKCNGHDRYAFRFLWTHHVIRLLLHFLRCYSQSGIRHLQCLTKIRFPVASLYIEYISHHILKVLIVKLVFHIYWLYHYSCSRYFSPHSASSQKTKYLMPSFIDSWSIIRDIVFYYYNGYCSR